MASNEQSGPAPQTGDHGNPASTAPAPKKVVKRVVKKVVDPSKPAGESSNQGTAIKSNGITHVPTAPPNHNPEAASSIPPKKVVKRIVKKAIDPSKLTQTSESTQQGTGVPSEASEAAPSHNAEASKSAPTTKKVVRRVVTKVPDADGPSANKDVPHQKPVAVPQAKPTHAHPSTEKALQTTGTNAARPIGSTANMNPTNEAQTAAASTKAAKPTTITNGKAEEVARDIQPSKTTMKVAPGTQKQQKPNLVSKDAPPTTATTVNQVGSLPNGATSNSGSSKPRPISKEVPTTTKAQAESTGIKKDPPPSHKSESLPASAKRNDTTLNDELRKELVDGVAKGVNKMFDGFITRFSK